MKKQIKMNQKGFTLIELLVVISIIGLLASVVLVSLNSARQKSRDAKRIADMNQLAKALELYFNENSYYPTSAASVGATGGLLTSANIPGLSPRFLSQIPSAPNPDDGACGGASGRGNNNYWYDTSSSGSTYTITFCLGDNVGGTSGIQSGVRSLGPGGFR